MRTSPLSQSTAALVGGALCLAILGGMIVGHAWPLWTGEDVLVRVVPVDPRDMFRGEYVRLNTPFTTLALDGAAAPTTATRVKTRAPWWDSGFDRRRLRGSTIYVQLERQPASGEYIAVTVSRRPVAGAINLKGRIRNIDAPEAGGVLSADYGLDAYFMQEGRPIAVEHALRDGQVVQVQVAIAKSGRARIRHLLVDGRRW